MPASISAEACVGHQILRDLRGWGEGGGHVRSGEGPGRRPSPSAEYATKVMTDKKTTFFVQPFKKPFEEKKEE
jgi:hypothetical protein